MSEPEQEKNTIKKTINRNKTKFLICNGINVTHLFQFFHTQNLNQKATYYSRVKNGLLPRI
jgi:hypothetical protein